MKRTADGKRIVPWWFAYVFGGNYISITGGFGGRPSLYALWRKWLHIPKNDRGKFWRSMAWMQRRFRCPSCGHGARTFQGLVRHVQRDHASEPMAVFRPSHSTYGS